MTDKLISFETAKLAKEKGFNIPVNGVYVDNGTLSFARDNDETDYNWNERKGYSAPTQSLLQKWLREKHDIHVNINSRYNPRKIGDKVLYCYDISTKENNYNDMNNNYDTWLGWNQENDIPILMYRTFNTFEKTLEVALQEALKLIVNPV
jgi:hypothetical protein